MSAVDQVSGVYGQVRWLGSHGCPKSARARAPAHAPTSLAAAPAPAPHRPSRLAPTAPTKPPHLPPARCTRARPVCGLGQDSAPPQRSAPRPHLPPPQPTSLLDPLPPHTGHHAWPPPHPRSLHTFIRHSVATHAQQWRWRCWWWGWGGGGGGAGTGEGGERGRERVVTPVRPQPSNTGRQSPVFG